jgi:hypothetical protein
VPGSTHDTLSEMLLAIDIATDRAKARIPWRSAVSGLRLRGLLASWARSSSSGPSLCVGRVDARRGARHLAVQPEYAPPASGGGPPGPPKEATAQSCRVNEPQVWRMHFLSAPASDLVPHSSSVRQIWTFCIAEHDAMHDVVP